MSFIASMPPARRRIWEAGLRAGIHDPEAQGRPRPFSVAPLAVPARGVPAPPLPEPEGSTPGDASSVILTEVAAKHRVRVSDITGRCQAAQIIAARQETAYRLHVEAGLTFSAIGELIDRSHTTAMHGAHGYASRFRLPSPVRGAGR